MISYIVLQSWIHSIDNNISDAAQRQLIPA